MAKYKKRADGRYMTHVTIGTQENGKPLRKTIYARTIRELEEQVTEIRHQVSTGTVITNDSVLVADWALEWLSTYKTSIAYNSRLVYEVMINAHIVPSIGHLKIKDVRPHHIQKLINEKLETGNVRTAQKIAMTVKQLFKKAVENNLIIKNYADLVELPKKEKSKKRALTELEKTYIKNAELDLKCRTFIYILLYAGLRKGEALALMKNDINLRENTLTVCKSLITIGNDAEIKPSPKSEAGNRVIPMPDILVNVLNEYLPTLETLYIFPTASGEIMSHAAFRRFWEKIAKRLNVAAGGNSNVHALAKDITPHIFRHTYATMLYYSGVDIKTAQYLLGHASAELTMEIYTHLDINKTKDAANKLNVLISSSQIVVNNNIEQSKNG